VCVRIQITHHHIEKSREIMSFYTRVGPLNDKLGKLEEDQEEPPESPQEEQQQEFICSSCSISKPVEQRERERENKNQVFVNSVLIIDLRNVARSLEIMEHLCMNVFVGVHLKDGD